jgi:hypothetical protein
VPGSNNTYQLVYTFNKPVTVPATATATKIQGSGLVGVPTLGSDPTQVIVPVRSVTNAQHLVINLSGVQSGAETANNQMARMDVLLGDVDGNGSVSGSDVNLVKARVGAPVSQTNFREDVDANASISGSDVNLVKSKVGTAFGPEANRKAGAGKSF